MRREILGAGIAAVLLSLATAIGSFRPVAEERFAPAAQRTPEFMNGKWALVRTGARFRCKTSPTVKRETIAVYSGAVEFDRHRDPVDSRQNAVWLSKGECVRIISESDKKLCVVTPDQQPQNNCLTVDKRNIAR
jgi:hypothetical protein